MALSLDTALLQVLLDCFDDQSFQWHQRVLLACIDGACWVAGTPDHEVEVRDLPQHRVIAAGRAEPFPQRAQGITHAFEQGRAAALAWVMGMEAP
eukprot:4082849-Alexandrium_andersonii.AAC.1